MTDSDDDDDTELMMMMMMMTIGFTGRFEVLPCRAIITQKLPETSTGTTGEGVID